MRWKILLVCKREMGYDNIMVFVEEYDITSFVKLFVWIETEFRLQRNGYVGVGTILKLKHLESVTRTFKVFFIYMSVYR